ncbi:hypothetical protein FHX75_1149 [Micromonospora palomenae]|uniref:Uncharacterized protein n=1 Tax=Micromonospora palomenae TaxID=1461247 RepID=A0A561WSR7_9ACTN|nr:MULTISPECIES: hypothetical protein [unclassified Micromonospora]MBM0259589.1 hypothetical protein [Micromonospora sp. 4G55]MBQ0896811.1 hypothetical protein [Micromonospora sp. U56]MDH6462590.1 hypothetical protein [Micromonospora sp. A200]TWG26915.1 hypothetical protein FHX75_1149 [Micromonospora palomenae]
MEPPGHDFVCASCSTPAVRPRTRGPSSRHPEPSMSRYVAPLGFTLAAVWVAVVFVLAGGGH